MFHEPHFVRVIYWNKTLCTKSCISGNAPNSLNQMKIVLTYYKDEFLSRVFRKIWEYLKQYYTYVWYLKVFDHLLSSGFFPGVEQWLLCIQTNPDVICLFHPYCFQFLSEDFQIFLFVTSDLVSYATDCSRLLTVCRSLSVW